MNIITWNASGYTRAKTEFLASLVRRATLVCITETYNIIPNTDDWHSICVQAPPTTGRHRRGGGVAILHSGESVIRRVSTHSEPKFQLISATVNGVPVVAAYVSPETPRPTYDRFLQIVTKALRGPGVLAGDLNARHKAWDDKTNTAGRRLHLWARTHNFKTQRPRLPTFSSHRGSSRVDLVLHRGPLAPALTVEDENEYSDHCPVRAELTFYTPNTLECIPLSMVRNDRCRTYAKARYETTMPPMINALKQASSAASLEINSRRLVSATLDPWATRCLPRPPRFKPGWTRALDQKAKHRSRLLKSPCPTDRTKARALDRDIKRQFRRNLRKLKNTVADVFAGCNPSDEPQLMKRAVDLDGARQVCTPTVDPDQFTEFMANLQPPEDQAPRVQPQCFEVPDSFREDLRDAIQLKLKAGKAPGPDKIRPEIFRLSPDMFAEAGLELWRAVGRLGKVPTLLSSGYLSPIYKKKGDPLDPTNNRPVCLTTAFRRLITTALTLCIRRHYQTSEREQWGFQDGSNTECAIAFAVNMLRRRYPNAAVLDLRKAYDCVPRHILQRMIEARLPPDLSTMIRPLLWPMRLRTKRQKSENTISTRAGMPQGDPPSPILFTIFMDCYIRSVNTSPDRGLVSLFVDDVLVLARSLSAMQDLLTDSGAWATSVQMTWAVQKSYGIQLPGAVTLSGTPLPDKDIVDYLGVSLGPQGVTAHRLTARINAAMIMLQTIMRITRTWQTTVRQRRAIVKTFIYSVVDYVLYLQPLSPTVITRASELELTGLRFITGVNLRTKDVNRAMLLTRMLPLRARRCRHMINAIAKFYSHANREDANPRAKQNWLALSEYSTVRPFIRTAQLPDTVEEIPGWRDRQLQQLQHESYNGYNQMRRKIPMGQGLPPIFHARIGQRLERVAALWYLNRIPASSTLSNVRPVLSTLLALTHLNDAEIGDAQDKLRQMSETLREAGRKMQRHRRS